MIPLHDDVPATRIPFVNYAIMSLCGLMFAWQVAAGDGNSSLVERLGMIPARITAEAGETITLPERVLVETPLGVQVFEGLRPVAPALGSDWLTLITCIFLHGGWLHFLGNMWFLWIFGDNVEDRLGHLGFAGLYLGTGVVAGLCHLLFNFDSPLPTIGASGAIAGVMGAYLYLFPYSRVVTMIPLIFLWPVVELPAPVFLGFWFLMQFWSVTWGMGEQTAGVAWWAHIGGFVAGLACAAVLPSQQQPARTYSV